MGALTIDAVAQEAGLSKGGLFYHFHSKKELIEGMVKRLILVIDSVLVEELVRSNGDFVTAYIRASFLVNPDWMKLSCALIAAVTNDPDLLEPLQQRFYIMQEKMANAAESPEIGTIIRLALDGMWISDLFGFAPPSVELREKMLYTLIGIANNK